MVREEKCSVQRCGAVRTSEISLHRMPKGEKDKENWTKFLLDVNNGLNWRPTEKIWICTNHFHKTCIGMGASGRRYIMKNHSPSIYNEKRLEYLACKQCLSNNHVTMNSESDTFEFQGEDETQHGFEVDITDQIGIFHCTPNQYNIVIELNALKQASLRKDQQILDLTAQLDLARKREAYYKHLYELKARELRILRCSKRKSDSRKRLNSERNTVQVKRMKCHSVQTDIVYGGRFNNDLILRILNRFNKPVTCPYPDDERQFAFKHHYMSSKGYAALREDLGKCLPSVKSLFNWIRPIQASPGILPDVISHIGRCNAQKRMLYSLAFDEMAIRVQYNFCRHTGRATGFVNYAGLSSEKKEDVIAKSALFCLATEINGSSCFPIAYILTNGCSISLLKDFMLSCINKVEETNATIISITFDGLRANFRAAEELGADLSITSSTFKPFIPRPESKRIYVYPDPIHMYKLLRNSFSKVKNFLTEEGNLIKWSLVERLVDVQSICGLRIGTKLTNRHVNFKNQKMKVRLAVQVISGSAATALNVLRMLGITGFDDSETTSDFLTLFNLLFDLLNSTPYGTGYRSPIRVGNQKYWRPLVKKAKQFLLTLKMRTKTGELRFVHETNLHTWVTGLYICLTSIELMFEDFVLNEKSLICIPLYKLCQDFIELFFGKIRKRYGNNNNPNSSQLEQGIKSIIAFKIEGNVTGNCIPQDETIDNACPLKSVANLTSEECLALNEDTECDNSTDCLPFVPDLGPLQLVVDNVAVYLAGFVGHSLIQSLKCARCITLLLPSDNSVLTLRSDHVLITEKDRGGLFYPSEYLISVCTVAEAIIRQNEVKGLQKLDSNKISLLVTQECNEKGMLSSISHFDSGFPRQKSFDENHASSLTKLIARRYASSRLNHIFKEATMKAVPEYRRSYYNKLTLNTGQ